MNLDRMITVVSVTVLPFASGSASVMARSNNKPGKVNLSKFESCLLAKDGSTDTWRFDDALTCCSNSRGYCMICPTDAIRTYGPGRFPRMQVILRMKSVAPAATTVAPVASQPSPVRPRVHWGTLLI